MRNNLFTSFVIKNVACFVYRMTSRGFDACGKCQRQLISRSTNFLSHRLELLRPVKKPDRLQIRTVKEQLLQSFFSFYICFFLVFLMRNVNGPDGIDCKIIETMMLVMIVWVQVYHYIRMFISYIQPDYEINFLMKCYYSI